MEMDWDELIEDDIEEGMMEPPPEEDFDPGMIPGEAELMPDTTPLGAPPDRAMGMAEENALNVDEDEVTSRDNNSRAPLASLGNEHDLDELPVSLPSRNEHFSFKMYNRETAWRAMAPNAAAIKAGSTLRDQTIENWTRSIMNNSRATIRTTPDAQLLQYLAKRQARVHTMKSKISVRMSTTPSEGTFHVPMTLGDGTRVYVPCKSPAGSSNAESNRSSRRHTLLGESMAVLLERVNTIRRRQELERQLRSTDHMSPLVDDDSPVDEMEQLASHLENRLWVDKHAPVSFTHLLSDERTNREVIRALRAWDPYVFGREPPVRPSASGPQTSGDATLKEKTGPNNRRDRRPELQERVILLSGPPGIGKTTLAHIVAHHVGYRPLEVNASDERSEQVLVERVVRAMESSTLSLSNGNGETSRGRPNCLILDEVDGADAKGAIQALVEIIKADIPSKRSKGRKRQPYLRRPIIFICNNKFAPALKPLLPFCRQFNVQPPSVNRLVARLRAVLNAEKVVLQDTGGLLQQLVNSTCGDIRSSLYTLQFASSRAKKTRETLTDISTTLASILTGEGMKDARRDVAGTIAAIFKKENEKKEGNKRLALADGERRGIVRILDAVQSTGDNSRILDCLFINLPHVPFVDPAFDRCAAALEWMSSSDTFRSHSEIGELHLMEALYVPSAAAAIHLLSRVGQRLDLTYSTRELFETHFQREANIALANRFLEGLSPQARINSGCSQHIMETIPFLLWILSAGDGSSALSRGAASLDLLRKGEQQNAYRHVEILCRLGLTYVPEHLEDASNRGTAVRMRLEPPIDRFVQFVDLVQLDHQIRPEIPSQMKELLARSTSVQQLTTKAQVVAPEGPAEKPEAPTRKESPEQAEAKVKLMDQPISTQQPSARKTSLPLPPAKRAKIEGNFLALGAKKAKEMRSARSAARVGISSAKENKKANTGSQVPLNRVVRLKYIKGFTQAVRTPCRLDDLA